RKVTRNAEITRVIDFLSEGVCKRRSDWKDRFKENTEKMRLGSIMAIAEVLKTLLILQTEKPLSFREKKMLDRARHMLITELSMSRGMCADTAILTVDKALAKAQLRLPEPM